MALFTIDPKKKKSTLDDELKVGINKTLKYDNNRTAKEVLLSAAKKGNIDPAFLTSSAWQEGMNKAVFDQEGVSDAYNKAAAKDKTLNDYPVDGFLNYGVDTFGDKYNDIKKYLPEGFDQRFKTYSAMNDATKIVNGKKVPDPHQVTTAAFKSNEDALIAKAAFLNYERDNVSNYAKSKGITPDQRTSDYFTLASYNGGIDNAKMIIDQYGQSKTQDKFIDQGQTTRKGVHNNIYPRLQRQDEVNSLLYDAKDIVNKQNKRWGITPASTEAKAPDANEMINVQKNNEMVSNTLHGFEYGGRMKKRKYANGTEEPIDPEKLFKQEPQLGLQPGAIGASQWTINSNNPGLKRPETELSNPLYQVDQEDQAKGSYTKSSLITGDEKKPFYVDEMAANIGITGINAFLGDRNAKKEDRTNLRKAIEQQVYGPTFNPYAQGTGSQAIMKKGGKMPSATTQGVTNLSGQSELLSSSDHSNGMFEFKGKTHDDGGIGIMFGGKYAEVENKEVGWVDPQGALNIFGKLKVPGTNKTFKAVAGNLAKDEKKIDETKALSIKILNNSDPSDNYDQSAISTAKVMFKSLDKQSMEMVEKKQALANFQTEALMMIDDTQAHQKYGGKMPRKPANYFAKGGKMTEEPDPVEALLKAIAKFESGSDYSKKGVVVTKGAYKGQRALGKYQIMPGNLKAWSKEVLGKEITPEEFLKSPELQDQIAKGRITELYNTWQDPQDVASIWFTGKPHKEGSNFATDDNGTSGDQYVDNVMKYYNQGGGGDDKGKYPPSFKQFYQKSTGKKFSSPQGLAPEAFYKDPEVIKALALDQTYPKAADDSNWGPEHDKLWNSLPENKKTELLTKSANTPLTTVNNKKVFRNDEPPVPYTGQEQQGLNTGVDTPYGKAARPAFGAGSDINIGNGDRKRDFLSPLAIGQIAPELLSLATNKQDPVYQQSYQPELKQTFDLSYQLGRNENQASFNQVAKIAENTGNIDALGQLAAQKYRADETYNNQEVQGNATQKLGVYGQNIDTLNDAKIKNIALIGQQQDKQAAAKFNTRKERFSALTSISAKSLQSNLENRTYNAYANLFKHYGFDNKGNVTFQPDEVVNKFSPNQSRQFGLLASQQGVGSILGTGNGTDYSRKFTTVDKNGVTKQTTEQLGTYQQISAREKALKAQGLSETIINAKLLSEFPN